MNPASSYIKLTLIEYFVNPFQISTILGTGRTHGRIEGAKL